MVTIRMEFKWPYEKPFAGFSVEGPFWVARRKLDGGVLAYVYAKDGISAWQRLVSYWASIVADSRKAVSA